MQPCQAEGQVTVMAAADHAGPDGICTSCSGCPGRHPGRRSRRPGGAGPGTSTPTPGRDDADAPGRFRALAGAWQVLGDPARRAAYDRALARERPPAARVTVRHQPGPDGVAPLVRMPGPPLRAGPVRIEASRPAPSGDGWAEEDIRLALLAELALRHLARDRRRPW